MSEASCMSRFHIVGGECNYLLRVNEDYRLQFVDDSNWMSPMMLSWSKQNVDILLDKAASVLLDTAEHLRLPVKARHFKQYSLPDSGPCLESHGCFWMVLLPYADTAEQLWTTVHAQNSCACFAIDRILYIGSHYRGPLQ